MFDLMLQDAETVVEKNREREGTAVELATRRLGLGR